MTLDLRWGRNQKANAKYMETGIGLHVGLNGSRLTENIYTTAKKLTFQCLGPTRSHGTRHLINLKYLKVHVHLFPSIFI